MNLYWKSLLISNVCNPLLKFSALWSQNRLNIGVNAEKTVYSQRNLGISLGYELSNSTEIAVQQKFDLNKNQLGKAEIGLKHTYSGNDYKTKISNDGLLSLHSRINVRKGLDIELSAESNVFGEKRTVGLYQAPLNFGLQISHKN